MAIKGITDDTEISAALNSLVTSSNDLSKLMCFNEHPLFRSQLGNFITCGCVKTQTLFDLQNTF